MLSWNPETLAVTLPIMLKGMVGIFAVIIVIWGFVALLNRIAGKKRKVGGFRHASVCGSHAGFPRIPGCFAQLDAASVAKERICAYAWRKVNRTGPDVRPARNGGYHEAV